MSSVLYKEKALLRRSKSMCSLSDDALTRKTEHHDKSFCDYADKRSRTASECSAPDSDSETSLEEHELGAAADLNVELLVHLELKMDRLSDLFLEQSRLLTTLKGAIQNSKDAIEKSGNVQSQLFAELDKNIITLQRQTEVGGETSDGESGNSRGRSLLEAIEAKHARTDVSDALALLLQTDELKERVVAATAAAVREELRACVARDVSAVCRPGLRRAQRRLAGHAVRALEDAFIELEEHGAAAARRVQRATRQLRRALQRHQSALENAPPRTALGSLRRAAEEILDSEMQQWRQKILQAISLEYLEPEGEGASPAASPDYQFGPPSPAQPHDPDHSIIDQLMQAAVINKQIEDGDVNGSFERALSASDLSLVVAACRAAEPGGIGAAGPGEGGAAGPGEGGAAGPGEGGAAGSGGGGAAGPGGGGAAGPGWGGAAGPGGSGTAGPARLQQPVLLALAQQLATDMLHDTQLKCRYLEEAIINLNPSNPATRAHLPTVVGEVRKHLMKFLLAYPNHVAGRRITLIVMAADNLLKYCC